MKIASVVFSISLVAAGVASPKISYAESEGDYVCYTWKNGKNGWCGTITEVIGKSVRIENYKVKCGKGGFFGICTNIGNDENECTGRERLQVDNTYSNPRSIIVPKWCLD